MIRKNQLRKAFATAAVAFSSIALTTPAYAWEYNPDKNTGNPIGNPVPIPAGRPKAPCIFDVYAEVKGGILTVQFVRPAGVCDMTVTSASDPVGKTYTFPSEAQFSTTVYTTDPELTLEIVTEEGTSYIGNIPIE